MSEVSRSVRRSTAAPGRPLAIVAGVTMFFIALQFVLAGYGIFERQYNKADDGWFEPHQAVGYLTILSIIAVLVVALVTRQGTRHRRPRRRTRRPRGPAAAARRAGRRHQPVVRRPSCRRRGRDRSDRRHAHRAGRPRVGTALTRSVPSPLRPTPDSAARRCSELANDAYHLRADVIKIADTGRGDDTDVGHAPSGRSASPRDAAGWALRCHLQPPVSVHPDRRRHRRLCGQPNVFPPQPTGWLTMAITRLGGTPPFSRRRYS